MFNIFRNIGSPEIIIIAVLAFFFFGGRKLGEFAKGIRESKNELKKIKEDLGNSEETEKGSQ
jgi:Sec-independent protein translocase protein TatA